MDIDLYLKKQKTESRKRRVERIKYTIKYLPKKIMYKVFWSPYFSLKNILRFKFKTERCEICKGWLHRFGTHGGVDVNKKTAYICALCYKLFT